MNIALIDLPEHRQKLFPFTMTRPIGDLRIGILTIREKWEKYLGETISFITDETLAKKFKPSLESIDLIINGSVCPNGKLIQAIQDMENGDALFSNDTFIAVKGSFSSTDDFELPVESFDYEGEMTVINRPWDLFKNNTVEIKADYQLITKGRASCQIKDPHTIVYAPENVFVEEGATIKAAILNAEGGPIYIGKDADIQEGATIRGPFVLGEGSKINMNSKIREGVTIGPSCKIGGEVSNSIVWGNSNKAHDGYLGNAVIGEFCNLGADTNNSNLKNNYDIVKVWDFEEERFISTGLIFCGLMMGDHSKSAINTQFNTGTVVGVACNIFGAGFPRTFLPSFSWGGVPKSIQHSFDKAIKTAKIVYDRKGIEFTEADEEILKSIFDDSVKYRQ